MISEMTADPARSVVFSVWDNDAQRLAGLYRAVRPEDLSKRPAAGFDGYFTLARLGDFLADLKRKYPGDAYVIRDWLAASAQDYYRTRLGWTQEDVVRHLPPNRVASGAGAPPPVLQIGGAAWEISGIELHGNSIGVPAGLPIEKARVVGAVNEYLSRRQKAKRSAAVDGAPMHWFRLIAGGRTSALKAFDRYLDEKQGRFLEIAVPKSQVELYAALRSGLGDKVRFADDAADHRYYFQTREDDGLVNEWWIGSHRDELLRAFGDL